MHTTHHRLNQKEPHILTLIIMTSFASMGAVIFTPALPEIADYFGISDGQSQLTMTLFLVGYSLGQLIYGPLSNRLGRKKAFYIGIALATLGSLVSILSEPLHSFYALILGRMLEALGSSAGFVISFTIINDYYFPDHARKVISRMMLAFAIIPGVAVFVGGALVTHFGWLGCFYFLLLYGLALAIPVYRLTETVKTLDFHALKTHHLIHNYRIAFMNPLLRNGAFLFGLVAMTIYIFSAASPIIAIHELKLNAQTFGLIGLIPYIGTGLGALTSSYLSKKHSPLFLIRFGWLIQVVGGVSLAILFYTHFVCLTVLIGCGFIFMFGGCIIMSNASALATSKSEDRANAVAMMNFICMGFATLGTLLLALLPGLQSHKLPNLWLVLVIIMFFTLRKVKLYTQSSSS